MRHGTPDPPNEPQLPDYELRANGSCQRHKRPRRPPLGEPLAAEIQRRRRVAAATISRSRASVRSNSSSMTMKRSNAGTPKCWASRSRRKSNGKASAARSYAAIMNTTRLACFPNPGAKIRPERDHIEYVLRLAAGKLSAAQSRSRFSARPTACASKPIPSRRSFIPASITPPTPSIPTATAWNSTVIWNNSVGTARPRPKELRRKVDPKNWPEMLEPLSDTYTGEPFIGPWA